MTTDGWVKGDGVDLVTKIYGDVDDGRATIVLVHGFPDDKGVWTPVAHRLAPRYRVVTYDVRGAGASGIPSNGYSLERLKNDLVAVATAYGRGRKVHVVGHDWGSIQSWEAATDEEAAKSIASFTSISGPCLDHVAFWMRDAGPKAIEQALRSTYVYAFGFRPTARFSIRSILPRVWPMLARQGLRRDVPAGKDLEALERGTELYRENVFRIARAPRPRRARVPVQLVVARRDAYVTRAIAETAASWCDDLVRRDVDAPHWVVTTAPDTIARFVSEFVDHVDGKTKITPFRKVGKTPSPSLVVITGAGSGIGRATAHAFAKAGARVVASDLDGASAEKTAEKCRALSKAGAAAYAVDVSDADAMERFAEAVFAEEGVPDVVVNNAGIGVAGKLLDTSVADFRRLVDVNLFGVLHGSRLFGARMVARGQGGHVVNVASAAAYTPSIALPAYATTKAAVLMLTECLRAELAADGIGVSAICPGIIDTPIVTASKYVGVPPEVEAKRRARAAALYKKRGVGPEKVAEAILGAVASDDPLVPVTTEAHVTRFLYRFAPSISRRLAKLEM